MKNEIMYLKCALEDAPPIIALDAGLQSLTVNHGVLLNEARHLRLDFIDVNIVHLCRNVIRFFFDSKCSQEVFL
jgi:hypothetical protein